MRSRGLALALMALIGLCSHAVLAGPVVDEPGSIHRPRRPAVPERKPEPEPRPAPKPAPEADPRAEVERQIRAWVDANNRFPEHRNPAVVMRFYAPDYVGTTDGAALTYDELEAQQESYAEHLKGPSPSAFTLGADVSRFEVLAPAVWAEYDSSAERVRDGQVLERYRRRCTGLFVKYAGEWRLKREDCVSPAVQTVPQPEP